MPRFRLTDLDDPFDAVDGTPTTRRRDRGRHTGPRVIVEGKSGRLDVDVDVVEEVAGDTHDPDALEGYHPDFSPGLDESAPYSSYDVAGHGPDPVPDWVVTDLSARDTPLGPLKSGKEADVSLLDRSLPGGPGCLLAVKTYRSAQHRMFHRDAGYQEGRRVRRSRETRAMANRSAFGRDLLSGKWAVAEFEALSRLWKAGARVPYPVQIIGSEMMMEFIGGPDGAGAPRLANATGSTADFTDLWHDLVSSLEVLAEAGLTHGDLSPFNVLVDDTGCVLIDLPQVVDLVANPQGRSFLERDCRNVAEFFARRGVQGADGELLAGHLAGLAVP